jgi:glycine dehydrogenase subunit 1
MLEAVGAGTIDDLFSQIPVSVRLGRAIDLPSGQTEQEVFDDLAGLARRNRSLDELVCFAGAGAYDHVVPAVVWALAGRSEFATSYTPYQPELSQGVLQTLFEFQSMVCELTGMEVSNASLYDGATALVEAVNMARRGEGRVLVSGAVDPRLTATLATYGRGPGYVPEVWGVPQGRGGEPPWDGEPVAAVVVQHPNVYGILEDVRGLAEAVHARGARLIQVFDPMTLGVLAPPGELGVDIAVAEGQALGNHLSFGGPYLGIIAARMEDVRRMPGRIVGRTTDVEGRDGYVLTLQAREQHIRREKATSNICTNQTLMAIAATVYLSWLGPTGLVEVGEQSAAKAALLWELLSGIDGVEPLFAGAPFLREFALRLPRRSSDVIAEMAGRGFLAGVPAPGADDGLLVALTERRTREEIDRYVAAMAEVLA